jgi:hypothetical protein
MAAIRVFNSDILFKFRGNQPWNFRSAGRRKKASCTQRKHRDARVASFFVRDAALHRLRHARSVCCKGIEPSFKMSDIQAEEKKRRAPVAIREMQIDDISPVFHLGERLFTSRDVPNLYHSWDEHEVLGSYYDDPEFCFVAEHEGFVQKSGGEPPAVYDDSD